MAKRGRGRGGNKKSRLGGHAPPNMGFFGGHAPPIKIIRGAKITEKIARYLVLKGQKFFNDPLKTCFLDESRGVSGKIFENPKFLAKIEFYCIFRPLFFENLPKFSKTAPSAPIFGPFGPENGQAIPPEEILVKRSPP